jgi:hypothetical protein
MGTEHDALPLDQVVGVIRSFAQPVFACMTAAQQGEATPALVIWPAGGPWMGEQR